MEGNRYFFFLFAAWVSADAATRFTVAGVFGLLSSFEAVDATFGDVFSFAIVDFPPFCRF